MNNCSTIQNKLVLFGAGKIGRSFIGQLFSKGGYEVVFVDIYKPVIDELNFRHNYNVVIKGEECDKIINVQNVRGVFAGDTDKVVAEISTARIVAVSIGLNGLKSIIPLIAKGLVRRYESINAKPLDIIIAENLRNAAEYMNQELKQYLPYGYPMKERVGLIETSIGKMVPIMLKKDTEEDILQVFAEPYNKLILDKLAFKNPIPEIEGLAPKENMKAWVDRKLFIHNLGHAAAAYFGFLKCPERKFLHEVLDDPEVYSFTYMAMCQSSKALIEEYPGVFTVKDLEEHIDDLLLRFKNKSLGDTVFRIGSDLKRKLGKDDRVVGAIKLAKRHECPYNILIEVFIYGLLFRAKDESGQFYLDDIDFIKDIETDLFDVLISVCGFNCQSDSNLILKIKQSYHRLSISQKK